jgi:hypothetical protein
VKSVVLLSNNICKYFIQYLIFHWWSFCYRNEKYGGTKNDHLIFNKQKDNRLCDELKKEETYEARKTFSPSSESQGRYQVEIKTGK